MTMIVAKSCSLKRKKNAVQEKRKYQASHWLVSWNPSRTMKGAIASHCEASIRPTTVSGLPGRCTDNATLPLACRFISGFTRMRSPRQNVDGNQPPLNAKNDPLHLWTSKQRLWGHVGRTKAKNREVAVVTRIGNVLRSRRTLRAQLMKKKNKDVLCQFRGPTIKMLYACMVIASGQNRNLEIESTMTLYKRHMSPGWSPW